ncbi:hypothetical protein [Streptomyces erythrochromogenes]
MPGHPARTAPRTGPLIFAGLTSGGVVSDAVLAFSIGAGLMVAAGPVAVFYAVGAEGRSLEDSATPLSAQAAEPASTRRRAVSGRVRRCTEASA